MAFHEPYYTTQGDYGLAAYFQRNLEQLLYNNAVDLVITGHVHAYERTFPVYNGTVRGWLETDQGSFSTAPHVAHEPLWLSLGRPQPIHSHQHAMLARSFQFAA